MFDAPVDGWQSFPFLSDMDVYCSCISSIGARERRAMDAFDSTAFGLDYLISVSM